MARGERIQAFARQYRARYLLRPESSLPYYGPTIDRRCVSRVCLDIFVRLAREFEPEGTFCDQFDLARSEPGVNVSVSSSVCHRSSGHRTRSWRERECGDRGRSLRKGDYSLRLQPRDLVALEALWCKDVLRRITEGRRMLPSPVVSQFGISALSLTSVFVQNTPAPRSLRRVPRFRLFVY